MIGEIFRAGTRALDDLQQQQENAERQKHVGKRYRPLGAGHQRQPHHRLGERYAGHQEDDDVVDRERNQKKRKTDHGHRRGLPFQASATIRSAAGNLLPYSLAEFRPPAIDGSGSVLAFRRSPEAQRIPGPNSITIPSWPSEPGGPCTCRSSDRGGGDGAIHRNPYPRYRLASSVHLPSGACHAARAMFFFWERPCRCPLGVLSEASSVADG